MLRKLRKHFTLATLLGDAVISGSRRPMGFEALTVGASTAVGLTLTTPPTFQTPPTGLQYRYAIIQNPHATIAARWRDDETDPTTTVGMRLVAGAVLEYCGDLAKIKFIAESSEITLLVSKYA